MAQSEIHEQTAEQTFISFAEFYPYYLSEHANDTSRRLHYVGSLLVLAILLYSILTLNGWLLLVLPLAGYGFAWVGHFFFEKNKPATFKYPLYSFMGDWVMLRDALTGRIRF
ncbi:MAG: Mpo1-like protein [Pseudomonas sp.]